MEGESCKFTTTRLSQMEFSESITQGCGIEYESVPMLQKFLMSQASLIKAEVFKHILCERNMQDFKQFILTCLERWKSGHYLQDKIETIFTLTQYPDDHYSFLFVYVFEGEIGHLCQYYSYGCKHVPVKTRSTSTSTIRLFLRHNVGFPLQSSFQIQ